MKSVYNEKYNIYEYYTEDGTFFDTDKDHPEY